MIAGAASSLTLLSKESSTAVFLSPSNNNIGEWFCKTLDLTVSDQAQSQTIILDRVVGRIDAQITDAIPTGTAKITLSSTSGSWYYFNSSFSPATAIRTVEVSLTSTDIGKTNFILGGFIIPLITGSITSDVSIRAYDSKGGLIADKIVKDVKVETNRKTILTGKLFTAAAVTSGFSIGINSDWNATDNTVNF